MLPTPALLVLAAVAHAQVGLPRGWQVVVPAHQQQWEKAAPGVKARDTVGELQIVRIDGRSILVNWLDSGDGWTVDGTAQVHLPARFNSRTAPARFRVSADRKELLVSVAVGDVHVPLPRKQPRFPNPEAPMDVRVHAADDIWVGSAAASQFQSSLWHWDGQGWTESTACAPGRCTITSGPGEELRLWCDSDHPNDDGGELVHFDGRSWSRTPVAYPIKQSRQDRDGTVWVVFSHRRAVEIVDDHMNNEDRLGSLERGKLVASEVRVGSIEVDDQGGLWGVGPDGAVYRHQ